MMIYFLHFVITLVLETWKDKIIFTDFIYCIHCIHQDNADNLCNRDFYVPHRSTISVVVKRNSKTVLFNKNTFSQE